MTKIVGIGNLTRGIRAVGQIKSPEDRTCIVPNVKPLHDTMFVSAHQINTDHSKLVQSNKSLSEYQVVVAVSDSNENFEVGDWVRVNVDAFPRKQVPGGHDVGTKHIVMPPLVTIGNTEYLAVSNRHILYKVMKDPEPVIKKNDFTSN